MEKQKRNVITREWVEKELRFYNRADLRHGLLLFSVCSVIFIPLTVLLVYGFSTDMDTLIGKIFMTAFVGIVISAPVWAKGISLWRILKERILLRRGEFHVVTRPLLYKRQELVGRHTEYFLFFKDFKRASVDSTNYELAERDDEFYLVYYGTRKLILLLYSAKRYEYQEP